MTHVNDATLQLSLILGLFTLIVLEHGEPEVETLPGQLIVGELPAAVTVTVKLQLSPDVELPVTTVSPCGKKQSLQ